MPDPLDVPSVGTTFYRRWHKRAGAGRVRSAWIKHDVRAIVDLDREADGTIAGCQIVIRHWTTRRGWRYEVIDAFSFAYFEKAGHIVVGKKKPAALPS